MAGLASQGQRLRGRAVNWVEVKEARLGVSIFLFLD
jgi:hypothetical protein